MRTRVSPNRRKGLLILLAALAMLAMGAYGAVFASIHADVTATAQSAVAQYRGDRVEALCAFVDCETCGLRERNRAVWALGQLRDARALPVLKRHETGRACDHSSELCQREIRKAVEAIQSRSALWLGYRDLPLRQTPVRRK